MKISLIELKKLAVVWGLEQFRFHLYGEQVEIFSDYQALETLLKRNKINNRNSANFTRWLGKQNRFDISLKQTAGKENKFTDIISCKYGGNPDQQKITKKRS